MGDIRFGEIKVPAGAGPPAAPNTILMVQSNPYGTDALQLDEEHRAIEAAIVGGRYRDRLRLVSSPAARYHDLPDGLHRHTPAAVHFSGHGSGTGGIVLSDDDRLPVAVPPRALADTFRLLGRQIRCVVLNACFTWPQAEAIARYVPCVVGTSRNIPDTLAIEFAQGFYAAAANGEPVATAFSLGRNRIDLGDRHGSDALMLIDHPQGAATSTTLHT